MHSLMTRPPSVCTSTRRSEQAARYVTEHRLVHQQLRPDFQEGVLS